MSRVYLIPVSIQSKCLGLLYQHGVSTHHYKACGSGYSPHIGAAGYIPDWFSYSAGSRIYRRSDCSSYTEGFSKTMKWFDALPRRDEMLVGADGRTNCTFWLLGGASKQGETHSQTLTRELLEEAGPVAHSMWSQADVPLTGSRAKSYANFVYNGEKGVRQASIWAVATDDGCPLDSVCGPEGHLVWVPMSKILKYLAAMSDPEERSLWWLVYDAAVDVFNQRGVVWENDPFTVTPIVDVFQGCAPGRCDLCSRREVLHVWHVQSDGAKYLCGYCHQDLAEIYIDGCVDCRCSTLNNVCLSCWSQLIRCDCCEKPVLPRAGGTCAGCVIRRKRSRAACEQCWELNEIREGVVFGVEESAD